MAIGRRGTARELLQSESGSVAVQLGLAITVLVGMASLGTEMTYLTFKHRQMQAAADSAALGGATALAYGYPVDFAREARAIAANAGFVNGVKQVNVAVNNPPTIGSHAGDTTAVEVIVSQPQKLGLVSVFRSGTFGVGARAVAVQGNSSLYCILALDPTASQAMTIANNGVVANPNCGVAVNSSSDSALTLANNATIKGPVSVHGNWSLSNNATLPGRPTINHAPAVTDPYAGMQLQTLPSCLPATAGKVNNNSTATLNPGRYCGWNFGNSAVVNLKPGTYYVDSMSIGTNLVLKETAPGVTIVIDGNYNVNFSNGANITITAPTTGPYAGMAFFGLRTATSTIKFANDTTLNIKGVIYFPNQTVEFDNNGATATGGCTQLIARKIILNNNVNLEKNCAGTAVQPLGSSLTQLAE